MGTSVSIPMNKDVRYLSEIIVPKHTCCLVVNVSFLHKNAGASAVWLTKQHHRYHFFYETSLCTQKSLQQDTVHTAVLLGFLISGKVVLLPVLGQNKLCDWSVEGSRELVGVGID